MKIRTGFVSNSSSSSFIIQINVEDADRCPCCGHRPLNIVDVVNRIPSRYCDDTSIETIEEYIRDNLDYERNSAESDLEEQIKKYRDLKAQGKKLYYLKLSYHDELGKHLLDECVDSGVVTILEGD